MDAKTRLAEIKTLLTQGRSDQAEVMLRAWHQREPEHAEVNAYLAGLALRGENWRDAVFHLEAALVVRTADIGLHQQLARVHANIQAMSHGGAILAEVLKILPSAYSTRLAFAESLLRDQINSERAHEQALRAISTANAQGFWLNDASTPPWLRPSLLAWRRRLQNAKQALAKQWLVRLDAQFGARDMQRVRACVEVWAGLRAERSPDLRQQPTMLYVPGLPAQPVFDKNELPSETMFQDALASVLEELAAVLQEDERVNPFFASAEEQQQMVGGASWDAYFFFRHGKRFDEAHTACPRTSALLQDLPLAHVPQHGPECLFSVLRPGAHILPHRGVTNARAVLHMGLVTPDDCALNVCDIAELHWQPGEIFAFDDTYLHEAWNRSTETRAVLLMDIWNPHLTLAEREALTLLIPWMGAYADAGSPELA